MYNNFSVTVLHRDVMMSTINLRNVRNVRNHRQTGDRATSKCCTLKLGTEGAYASVECYAYTPV